MSENIQSIANGSFVLGQTSATNFVAGPGIKIDEPSAGTVRIGNDETVIFEGDLYYNTTGLLSEPITNFERVRVVNKPGQYVETYSNWSGADTPNTFVALYTRYDSAAQGVKYMGVALSANGTTIKETYNKVVAIPPTANVWSNVNDGETHIYKIMGINRKEV